MTISADAGALPVAALPTSGHRRAAMHDIKLIRDDIAGFENAMRRREVDTSVYHLWELYHAHRISVAALQDTQTQRNNASRDVGIAKLQGDHEKAISIQAQSVGIKALVAELEEQEERQRLKLDQILAGLPNTALSDVPDGIEDSANTQVARHDSQRRCSLTTRDHADLGPPLGLDFETGAALSGARFTFLRGQIARLERALGQFMLDNHTGANGYVECAPPLLVRDEAMFGTGQLPKFADDLFKTTDGRWLIPTAEVSLTNAVAGKILTDAELPIRMTALTPCFRSEAGAAGRDTRGYIRQHQFNKVELVSICAPEQSEAEHAHMLASAEAILRALDLPYRTMLLCAGDMGFSAEKTYDLEVWLPGQGAYREISSVSRCGAFQARRMNARFKRKGAKGTEFVHTLNGSGLAVGRTLVAVLENYQNEDGSVNVPEALHPYMGGITRLVPNT